MKYKFPFSHTRATYVEHYSNTIRLIGVFVYQLRELTY